VVTPDEISMTEQDPETKASPKVMPWAQFYFSDWLGDEKLLLCSLGARGLWMHILCLMHKSPRRGYLLKPNSQAYSLEELALSTQSKLSEIRKFWLDLEGNCVFSRDGSGMVYSRRMVRDIAARERAFNDGCKGGNQSQKKTPPPTLPPTLPPTPTPPLLPTVPPTGAPGPRSQKPETRDQSVVGGHQVVGATAPVGGSLIGMSNHPKTEAEVFDYFQAAAPGVFSADAVHQAWLSFEATAVNGEWFWGARPVSRWHAAVERRMADQRKNPALPVGEGQQPRRVTPLLPSQELKMLDDYIWNHPANDAGGPNYLGDGCVPKNLAASFRKLLDRRDALGRQLPPNP